MKNSTYILESVGETGVRQEMGEFSSFEELNKFWDSPEFIKDMDYEIFEKRLVVPKFKKCKAHIGDTEDE